jgi:hypothetical protein
MDSLTKRRTPSRGGVQLVRHPGGQLADHRQTLGPVELPLELLVLTGELVVPEALLHRDEDLLDGAGLREDAEGALAHERHGVLDAAVAGEDDDDGLGSDAAHLSEDLESVSAGHPEVADDQGDGPTFEKIDTLVAAAHGLGLVARGLERGPQELPDVLLVVDDEDPFLRLRQDPSRPRAGPPRARRITLSPSKRGGAELTENSLGEAFGVKAGRDGRPGDV